MISDVERGIHAEIEARGPITFARFMELALYGPGGYYEHPPVGMDGDFLTSPHVHPLFGELLARAVRGFHDALGRPEPLRLVEAGAGDGTLARQLLGSLSDLPVGYTAVDTSPGAREALAAVPGLAVAASLETPFEVLVANELLDNLPFRILHDGLERRIGLDPNRGLREVAHAADAHLSGFVGRGDGIVPTGALDFIDRLADGLTSTPGYALLIDYGAEAGEAGGQVHGYRDHALVQDVLARVGESDITAGVDFGLLADRASQRGAVACPLVTQRAALVALGFEAWFHEQLAAQHAALEARDGMAAVRTWSGKSRASLLADPGGLGRFRWLVLASPGLPPPDWLLKAASAEGPS